jgi:hypothetical protein
MKRCRGSENDLRDSLDNIVKHYKGQHRDCPPESRCQKANYASSRLLITQDIAEKLLIKCIRGLFIYQNPQKYVHCIDTHYVESFNNVVLIYVDKRVHFGSAMYALRLNLAILDWNEHVDREATSLQPYVKAKNPHSQAPSRVLSPKQFNFVNILWGQFKFDVEHQGNVHVFANIEDIALEIEQENSFVNE